MKKNYKCKNGEFIEVAPCLLRSRLRMSGIAPDITSRQTILIIDQGDELNERNELIAFGVEPAV